MSQSKKTKKAIIIGAGIAGCSTAYALAKRGIVVSLIERHSSIAEEASGNPVAALYPKLSTGESILSNVANHGLNFTLALLKQLPNNGVYNLCGQIQLAFNVREQAHQEKLMHANSTHSFQPLSATDASDIANIHLNIGGIYLPNTGWVNPKLLCEALIVSPLITTITCQSAINITKSHTGWQVSLKGKEDLETGVVVICNANDISQFDVSKNIPVTPVRGQVNFFPANSLSKQLKTIICSDHYLSPAVSDFHSVGTSYAPNDMNLAVSNLDTQANLQALKKISSTLYNSVTPNAVTGRVAWRSATKDYLPIAGQLIDQASLKKASPRYNDNPNDLPWLKGLYLNAGHGSKGMTTAPMCGELVANLINNEPLIINKSIASNLNPNRFMLKELGLKKMAQSLYDF